MERTSTQTSERAQQPDQSVGDVVGQTKQALTETAQETMTTAKSAAQEIASTAQDQMGQAVEQTASQVADTVAQVKEQVGSAYTNQRDWAVAGLNGLADALREAARNLELQADTGSDEATMPALYPMVEDLADRIGASADFLQGKEMRQLLDDAESLAKRQPLLFAGALFGIGVVGARLLKGSSGATDQHDSNGSAALGSSGSNTGGSAQATGASSASNTSQRSPEMASPFQSTGAGQTGGSPFDVDRDAGSIGASS